MADLFNMEERHEHEDVDDSIPNESEPMEEIEEMKEIVAEVEKSQSLSERFRKELEGYLDELDHKTTSDGEALIEVPENFDNIVQAMTREDLQENGQKKREKPWYDYIIRDHVNKKLEKDFKGRYRNIIETTEDDHIRKGMAEILMLDRQLWLLSKKAQLLAEDHDDSKLPRGTPGTPASRKEDRTFITKLGSSTPRSSGQQVSSRPKSGFQSSRQSSSQGNEEYSQVPDGNNEFRADNGGESLETMQRNLKSSQWSAQEQEQRFKDLLSASEDAWIEPYYSEDFDKLTTDIDNRLNEFGHLDRLQSTKDIEDELKFIDSKDYLTQQRLERKRNQYTTKVDSLLETYGSLATAANFTNEYSISSGRSHILDSDLSSLLAMSRQDDQQSQLLSPQSQASQSISRGMYNPRLHEVPCSIDEIRPDVPITREDINRMIFNLRMEYRAARQKNTKDTTQGNSQKNQRSRSNSDCSDNEDDMMSSAKTSPRSSRPATSERFLSMNHPCDGFAAEEADFEFETDEKTRERIDELLQEYAIDVQRLSDLRASSRISARLFAGDSLVSSNSSKLSSRASTPSSKSSSQPRVDSAVISSNTKVITTTIQQGKGKADILASSGLDSQRNRIGSSAVSTTVNATNKAKNVTADAKNTQSSTSAKSKSSKSTATNSKSQSSSKKMTKKAGQMLMAHDQEYENDGDMLPLDVLPFSKQTASSFTEPSEYSPPSHSSVQLDQRVEHEDFEEEPAFSRSDLFSHPDFDQQSTPLPVQVAKHANPQQQPQLSFATSSNASIPLRQARSQMEQQRADESDEADRQLQALAERQRQRQLEIAALQEERERLWQSLMQQSDRLDNLQQMSSQAQDDAEDNAHESDNDFDPATAAAIAAAAKAATAAAMARLKEHDDGGGYGGGDDDEDDDNDHSNNSDQIQGKDFEIQADAEDHYGAARWPSRPDSTENNSPRLKLPPIASVISSQQRSLPTEDVEDDDHFFQQALRRLDLETQRAMQRSMQPLANNPRVKQPATHAATNRSSEYSTQVGSKLIASPPPSNAGQGMSINHPARRQMEASVGSTNNQPPAGESASQTPANVTIMREKLLNQVREYVEI